MLAAQKHINDVVEELHEAELNPRDPRNYLNLTPRYAFLTRHSAINDRIIYQAERGMEFFESLHATEYREEIEMLKEEIRKRIRNQKKGAQIFINNYSSLQ